MDLYLNPDFAINIKRRALFRGITLVVLVVAAISILYGVWGPTLTPAVPDDLTAVRLDADTWQRTITDPQALVAFTEIFSSIGPLPKARPNGEIYFGYTTVFITLVDSTGGEVTYAFSTGGSLRAEDSAEFEFRNNSYQALEDWIHTQFPEGSGGWWGWQPPDISP